jgi:hypothetical protein
MAQRSRLFAEGAAKGYFIKRLQPADDSHELAFELISS